MSRELSSHGMCGSLRSLIAQGFHATGAELARDVRELESTSRKVFIAAASGMQPSLFIGSDTDQGNDNDPALVPGRLPLPICCARNDSAGLWHNCPD